MVNEINHRDTYFDTWHEDNWDDNQREHEEYIVYVTKGDEVLEYTRCGCEMEAQGEVDKLTKIGVNARY